MSIDTNENEKLKREACAPATPSLRMALVACQEQLRKLTYKDDAITHALELTAAALANADTPDWEVAAARAHKCAAKLVKERFVWEAK